MNDSANQKPSWWQRLTSGLKRTSASIGGAIADIVTKRKLDTGTIEELEEVLIRADLGVATAARLAAAVADGGYDKSVTTDEVKTILAAEVERIMAPVAQPLAIDAGARPFVILVVGVNGSGKTTTIGKLAARFRSEGHSVMLAAGDTFRAAAIDQLKIWGERGGAPGVARGPGAPSRGSGTHQLKIWGERAAAPFVAREPGADAAGLAFEALSAARAAAT